MEKKKIDWSSMSRRTIAMLRITRTVRGMKAG